MLCFFPMILAAWLGGQSHFLPEEPCSIQVVGIEVVAIGMAEFRLNPLSVPRLPASQRFRIQAGGRVGFAPLNLK